MDDKEPYKSGESGASEGRFKSRAFMFLRQLSAGSTTTNNSATTATDNDRTSSSTIERLSMAIAAAVGSKSNNSKTNSNSSPQSAAGDAAPCSLVKVIRPSSSDEPQQHPIEQNQAAFGSKRKSSPRLRRQLFGRSSAETSSQRLSVEATWSSPSSSETASPSPRRSGSSFRQSLAEEAAEASNGAGAARPSSSSNTLTIPSISYGSTGAIPRTSRATSSESSPSTSEARQCFCGYYSESSSIVGKKPGRCKFCRCKAKYVSGQRSFDATRFFGRRRESTEPRRAVSEDQGPSTSRDDASGWCSSGRCPQSMPFLRRQDRLQESSLSPSSSRDHGLQTPPGPPSLTPLNGPRSSLRPAASRHRTNPDEDLQARMMHSHQMSREMSEYLVPPPRSSVLGRAHSDPSSTFEQQRCKPISPPPTYEEVLQEPRLPPPSYEEALTVRLSSVRVSNPVRSYSEERTRSTMGAAAASVQAHGVNAARNANSGYSSNTRMPLTRSRAEDIPDIYWQQAARELDFCTCRKCQARYRQYFEEGDVNDGMMPIETQWIMQEVLTDGMAICSLQ